MFLYFNGVFTIKVFLPPYRFFEKEKQNKQYTKTFSFFFDKIFLFLFHLVFICDLTHEIIQNVHHRKMHKVFSFAK